MRKSVSEESWVSKINMKNDNLFRSLSRMAEEYDRLVSPLTEQLKIYDRWHEIASPLLRVAEMHNDKVE